MSPFSPKGETRSAIFSFIKNKILEGQSPTVREVQLAFSFKTPRSAAKHIEKLIEEGKLEKSPDQKSRGLRLAAKLPERSVKIPLLGRVQAGELSEAIELAEGYISCEYAEDKDEIFALRVKGESMILAGIMDGDIVIVKRQERANNGEIIVALVDNEATVKRFYQNGSLIELRPENDSFKIIRPDPENTRILGKVIECRRYFK